MANIILPIFPVLSTHLPESVLQIWVGLQGIQVLPPECCDLDVLLGEDVLPLERCDLDLLLGKDVLPLRAKISCPIFPVLLTHLPVTGFRILSGVQITL